MAQGPVGGAAQSFPCGNCGGRLQYDAASQSMLCPSCGQRQATTAAAGGVRDIPLEEGMRLAARGLGAPVTTIQCKECGATVNVGQGERTTSCAFCGSKEVLGQETNAQAIRPESLVPFRMSREEANKKFAAWLSGLWFRPSNLKRMASVQEMGGVYVPFWSFNAQVWSQWTAERGYHYDEEERYVENGQEQTRRVQKTRWEPAQGSRSDGYRDVLVCASKGLPQELVDGMKTFDERALTPYQPDYLAGWRAESYAVDLMPGWQHGQEKIAREQEGRCRKDVGGDEQRNLQVANAFSQVSFKHVLLPIWIAAYRYEGKVFRFLVNGQTGEVVGKAPWSVWKIVALVLAIVAIIALIAVLASRGRDDRGGRHAELTAPAWLDAAGDTLRG